MIGLPDAAHRRAGVRVRGARARRDARRSQTLADHCRSLGLAAQKCPEQLELVDALPRNPMGKVLKQDLRAHVA